MFFRKKKEIKVGEEGYIFKYYLEPFNIQEFYPPPPAPDCADGFQSMYEDPYKNKLDEYYYRVNEWKRIVDSEEFHDKVEESLKSLKELKGSGESEELDKETKEDKIINRFEYLDLND